MTEQDEIFSELQSLVSNTKFTQALEKYKANILDQPPLSLIFELDQVVNLRQQIKTLQVD